MSTHETLERIWYFTPHSFFQDFKFIDTMILHKSHCYYYNSDLVDLDLSMITTLLPSGGPSLNDKSLIIGSHEIISYYIMVHVCRN